VKEVLVDYYYPSYDRNELRRSVGEK
jgi:hypothetical protein